MSNNIIHLCCRQQTWPPFQGGAFACGSHPGLKHLGYSVFPLRGKAVPLLAISGSFLTIIATEVLGGCMGGRLSV
jgi:hypothetical protein